MPEKLHRELKAKARAKGLKGKRADAYVFGTMQKVKEGGHVLGRKHS